MAQYHFFKSGYANSLFPLCIRENLIWVGYGNVDQICIYNDVVSNTIKENYPPTCHTTEKQVPQKKLEDLIRLFQISKNKDDQILFSFFEDKLYFFKLKLNNQSKLDFKKYGDSDCQNYLKDTSLYKCVVRAFAPKDKTIESLISEGFFLEVEHIQSFSRSDLLPSINSLSVYQYFNRGTVRPISAANSDKESSLNMIKDENLLKGITDYLGNTVVEKRYGAFIRFYFDWLLIKSCKKNNFEDYLVGELGVKISNIPIMVLNPSQLEMIAALLLSDCRETSLKIV